MYAVVIHVNANPSTLETIQIYIVSVATAAVLWKKEQTTLLEKTEGEEAEAVVLNFPNHFGIFAKKTPAAMKLLDQVAAADVPMVAARRSHLSKQFIQVISLNKQRNGILLRIEHIYGIPTHTGHAMQNYRGRPACIPNFWFPQIIILKLKI